MKTIPIEQIKTKPFHVRIARKAGALAAGAVLVGAGASGVAQMLHHTAHHDISYMDTYPKKKEAVGPNEGPDSMLKQAGEGELTGDARTDAENYIRQQGLTHDNQGNPMLADGQTVEVPIVPEGK